MGRLTLSERAQVCAPARAEDDGFTLVEVLVAMVLLAGLTAAMATTFFQGMRSAADLQRRQVAVTIAEQVMENATSVVATADGSGCVPLLNGRDRAAVLSQWSRLPDGAELSRTEPVWNPDTCPAAVTVPFAGIGSPVADDGVTPATVRLGVPFVVRTVIGTCRQRRDGGECVEASAAPPGSVTMYRIVVHVQWQPGCTRAACRYLLAELVDPGVDPAFNTRTALPPVAVDDRYCTVPDMVVMLSLLANDSGHLGASPVEILSPPSRGTLGDTADTGYTSYLPAPGVVNKQDSFTYRLLGLDGRVSGSATVKIDVRKPGGCP